MSLVMVATFLVSTTTFGSITLRVEAPLDLSPEEADRITRAVVHEVESRFSDQVLFDDGLWADCTDSDRCLQEIVTRTRSRAVIVLRYFGGPIRIRIEGEGAIIGQPVRRINAKVPRDPEAPIQAMVAEIVQSLLPDSLPFIPKYDPKSEGVLGGTTETSTASFSAGPWPVISLAAGTAAAAVGIAFGVASNSAKNDAMSSIRPREEADFLESRMKDRALVANICFGLAAGLVITAAITFFAER